MEIFEIRNNEPSITPEGVFIPEFKDIWDRDENEFKSVAKRQLAYVYHMSDPKSAYANTVNRESLVKDDYLDGGDADELLLKAIEKYKQLKETPTLKALKSCEALLMKMSDFFDSIDLEEFTVDDKTGKKTFVHDIGKITGALGKFENVVSTIRKLKSEVEKEAEAKTIKKRGNVRTSILDE